jgi:methylated-DNA-[protein]-cysteine S-methyltransferase
MTPSEPLQELIEIRAPFPLALAVTVDRIGRLSGAGRERRRDAGAPHDKAAPEPPPDGERYAVTEIFLLTVEAEERRARRGLRRPMPTSPAERAVPAAAAIVLAAARRQLTEYFAGERRVFDLLLDPRGTGFERRVWREVAAIPYGETRSYSAIAHAAGRPDACRAVGHANGSNPIPLVIPCHRVIGANGSLTGYGGGLRLKRFLLDLEGAAATAGRTADSQQLGLPLGAPGNAATHQHPTL